MAINQLYGVPGQLSPQQQYQQQFNKHTGQAHKEFPEGFANYYDDSWAVLAEQLSSGAGPSTAWANVLKNFKGSGKNLEAFMRNAAPFFAATLYGSQGYKYMQDPKNWDNAMESYGAGAGKIGQGAQAGLSSGQQQLAQAGLARSGASAGLSQQASMNAAGEQANLYSGLNQQSLQNRLSGAQGAFDADAGITSMALGMNPQPRLRQASGSSGLGTGLGTALGTLLGGLLTPGAGAGAGTGLGINTGVNSAGNPTIAAMSAATQ